jgi:hypothetical protein
MASGVAKAEGPVLTADAQRVRLKTHYERSSRSCQPAYPGKVAAPTGRCGRSGNEAGKPSRVHESPRFDGSRSAGVRRGLC